MPRHMASMSVIEEPAPPRRNSTPSISCNSKIVSKQSRPVMPAMLTSMSVNSKHTHLSRPSDVRSISFARGSSASRHPPRIGSSTPFKRHPFTYQVPFVINTFYILFISTYLTRHLVGSHNVLCAVDEKTNAYGIQQNIICAFNGLVWLISLYGIIIYEMALSISIFITLHYPSWTWPKKRRLHTLIGVFLGAVAGYLVLDDRIAAGFVGTCAPVLSSKKDTVFYFYVLPASCGALVTPTFLIISCINYEKCQCKKWGKITYWHAFCGDLFVTHSRYLYLLPVMQPLVCIGIRMWMNGRLPLKIGLIARCD
eukprot:1091614_1